MMPDELKKGAAHLRGDDYEYSREFFDLLKEKPKLEIRHQNKGSYESMHGKLVVFDNDTRFVASPWMRKSIAYHEFGHAIADQRNLLYTKEVTDLRTKQIARLRTREKATIWAREWGTNPKTGKWDKVKVRKEVSQMRAKTIADRLDYLYSRIREKTEDDPIFKRYGMTKADVIEQICAAQDTLKSLINSVGWGHSTAYFKQAGHSEHEYLAHCFENAFIGNRVFQLYMPTEYAEMIALAKSFKF